MSASILLIEDDVSGRELAAYNLSHAGYKVVQVSDGISGLNALEKENFDLVITDVKMPGISGIEVLRRIKKVYNDLKVIVISAYAEIEPAIEAMKLGAEDFLGKPFTREHLLIVVKKALENQHIQRELLELRVANTRVERPIVFKSDIMRELLEMTDRFAASEASVLIFGPSGSGKELIARRIHSKSKRALSPFVPVNLAAIPESLLESELFGHIKGSFTGALNDRQGRFRQASGGTIFLDEISELPIKLQSKLLRVLQEKVVDPVGSDTHEAVDVRIVAATNSDLELEIKEGRFREDLYYRINVVALTVPRLAERISDIELLARYFVHGFAQGRTVDIPENVIDALLRHNWNGNVRELENVCQRLVLLSSDNTLRVEDLPFSAGSCFNSHETPLVPSSLPSEGFSLMDLEKQVILRVLEYHEQNVSKAAQYLKVPRHVLAYRMEKYGIKRN